jgi:hypothetical protein
LKTYNSADWINLKGDDVWRKVHHMIIDSVDDGGGMNNNWVRGAGFDEAWEVSSPPSNGRLNICLSRQIL